MRLGLQVCKDVLYIYRLLDLSSEIFVLYVSGFTNEFTTSPAVPSWFSSYKNVSTNTPSGTGWDRVSF